MSNEMDVGREAGRCGNCGADLSGDYCHACGQARKSPLRHLPALAADAADTVLSLDGRLMHTVPALFLRPGCLSNEYFAGRRVRYIPPFRLAFLLCLLAMFVSHLAVEGTTDLVDFQTTAAFDKLDTPAAVTRSLDRQLQDLASARQSPGVPAVALAAMDRAEAALKDAADARLQELGARVPAATASAGSGGTATNRAAPTATDATAMLNMQMSEPGIPFEPITWLPDFLNALLRDAQVRINDNIAALSSNDQATRKAAVSRIVAGTFAALPPAMFLMLPVFALLLKLLYVLRRRLYIEHVIVALHSHAFIFLSLLLMVAVGTLASSVAGTPWQPPLNWLLAGLAGWVPVYLLIMQKRVYGQGWPMTLIKYLVTGSCYVVLLAVVLIAAIILGAASG